MKRALHDIPGEGLSCKVVEGGWFPDEEIDRTGPVDGELFLVRTGSTEVEVTGRVRVAMRSHCARCGRELQADIGGEFRYDCVVGRREAEPELPELEGKEEESNLIYFEEPVIDLGHLLREQLLLAVPMRVLCSDSCRGLCPSCGKDLNGGSCSCRQEGVRSPFKVLEKLKKNRL